MSSQRLLLPTDFSPTGDLAFSLAASIARHTQSELMLLHVQDPASPEQPDLSARLDQLYPDDKQLVCSRHFVEGQPAAEIMRFAADHDVDLIVIGTHGSSGLASVLVGSVAEKVIASAPCPVLAIKTAGHARDSDTPADAAAPPTIGVKELIELLTKLVSVCVDSARGLQEAASDAKHAALRMLLAERADQRTGFAEELQTLAALRGSVPKRKGSLHAAIERGWTHLKTVLGVEDDKALLHACILEEEYTAEAYEEALKLALSDDVRETLERHLQEVVLLDRALSGMKGVLELGTSART